MADHSHAPEGSAGELGSLQLDDHFAIIREWVLDAPISDCALRLYAVLLRYGQGCGARMPGGATLAKRLRKSSTDTVDRAMRELVQIGAVHVEHRNSGRQRLTNRYHVRTHRPAIPASGGGRNSGATPTAAANPGRTDQTTPGRVPAGTPAADLRPNPKSFTQDTPPPPPRAATGQEETRSDHDEQLLLRCGITDLNALAHRCQQPRRDQHLPTTRWAAPCLRAALHLAVINRQWPAVQAQAALLAVAAGPILDIRDLQCLQHLEQGRLIQGHRVLCPSAKTIGVGFADHHTVAPSTWSPTPSGPTTYTTRWDVTAAAAHARAMEAKKQAQLKAFYAAQAKQQQLKAFYAAMAKKQQLADYYAAVARQQQEQAAAQQAAAQQAARANAEWACSDHDAWPGEAV